MIQVPTLTKEPAFNEKLTFYEQFSFHPKGGLESRSRLALLTKAKLPYLFHTEMS